MEELEDDDEGECTDLVVARARLLFGLVTGDRAGLDNIMPSDGQIVDEDESGQYESAFGDVARRTFGLVVGERAKASSWLLSRIPEGADVLRDMKLRRNVLNAVVFFGLL